MDRHDASRRRGWDGAAVVLRGRESRSHGEGRQRVSKGGKVMSEDAPVNSGAVKWPHPDSAYFTVGSMQIKLHRWAGEISSRRFGDLFNLVYDPAFLVHAWERVSGNKGAQTPGVDKATVAMIETWVGVEEFLGQIRDSLKSGGFRPVEVRQVTIRKGRAGKSGKLGIPAVADRVVQASRRAVLEAIFEADFQPCSYGFRPNRRAQDAIAEIDHYGTSGYRWVLECDIKACFDEIDHTALMDRLRARIKDKRIGALVKAFLKSGVLTELGNREETLTGTPQGGILTPPTQRATSALRSRWVTGGWSAAGERCGAGGARASPARGRLVPLRGGRPPPGAARPAVASRGPQNRAGSPSRTRARCSPSGSRCGWPPRSGSTLGRRAARSPRSPRRPWRNSSAAPAGTILAGEAAGGGDGACVLPSRCRRNVSGLRHLGAAAAGQDRRPGAGGRQP